MVAWLLGYGPIIVYTVTGLVIIKVSYRIFQYNRITKEYNAIAAAYQDYRKNNDVYETMEFVKNWHREVDSDFAALKAKKWWEF